VSAYGYDPADAIPYHETARYWLESMKLDLEHMTPNDLLVELRTALMDAEIVASGYDLADAPF
jgi:hypothetical protein